MRDGNGIDNSRAWRDWIRASFPCGDSRVDGSYSRKGFLLAGAIGSFSCRGVNLEQELLVNQRAGNRETARMPYLVITQGPDKGRVFELVGREVWIGRSFGCGIHLLDSTVSRRQCRIVREGRRHWLVERDRPIQSV